jgi:hypothetical protein
MLNIQKLFIAILAAGSLLVTAPVQAQTKELFNVSGIIVGQTQTIDVIQTDVFPLGCQHFFVGVGGKGILGISLVKSDRADDGIFMTGIVSSSAGTFVITRVGVSKGMLSQTFEVGDNDKPYGFVWLWSGIALSAADPSYAYQVRFSLAP